MIHKSKDKTFDSKLQDIIGTVFAKFVLKIRNDTGNNLASDVFINNNDINVLTHSVGNAISREQKSLFKA